MRLTGTITLAVTPGPVMNLMMGELYMPIKKMIPAKNTCTVGTRYNYYQMVLSGVLIFHSKMLPGPLVETHQRSM